MPWATYELLPAVLIHALDHFVVVLRLCRVLLMIIIVKKNHTT